MNERQAELFFDAKGRLSESPQWSSSEQALYWVDIENGLLHRLEWGDRRHECIALPAPVTMVSPGPPLLVTSGNRLLRLDPHTRDTEPIAALALDPDRVRFNDGRRDPQGRLWLGTMAVDERSAIASLYRLDRRVLAPVLTGVSVSNGIAWHGHTMYYADSGTFRVDAFDYDPDRGVLHVASRRTVASFSKQVGPPDGMAIDANGNLWIALVNGARVSCVSPESGDELERITLDVAKVTACCFGGPEMTHLFISTGREAPDDPPGSGAIFVATPGVRGAAPANATDTA